MSDERMSDERIQWSIVPPEVLLIKTEGIRVLSPREAAKLLGKSKRQLSRLELLGKVPSRRLISKRRTGYLLHELQGLSAASVLIRDSRTLLREEVANKLGITERTVTRMARQGEMPRPVRGRWSERDLDTWLHCRPRVR